jgi:colanic acid biosynthesis glycosyl transferase WcaI
MKVLLFTNYFPPEIGSGPHLPYELGETLVQRGHEVTVVTGFPRYNVPTMPAQYQRKLFYREELGGMQVRRVRAPIPYGGARVSRGLFHLLMPLVLALRCFPLARPDIIYSITPPLASGLAAKAVAKRFRVPCVVNVQDLFPQNAVDLGLLRNRALIRSLEALERLVYRAADAITVISDANGDHVVAKGARRQNVHTILNWVDTDLIQPRARMNGFRRSNAIGEEFVVLFAGTMGWSQGIEVVVEAARRLTAERDLLFLLVGDGVQRRDAQKQAAGLRNIRFLPMQPKERYPDVLAASDACLVTLRPEVVTPTPSKLATIMAAGRPVLASAPPGEATRWVDRAGCGFVTRAGDAESLANAVLELKRRPESARQMGRNGRRFAETQLSRDASTRRLEELFAAIVGSPMQGVCESETTERVPEG